MAQQSTLGDLCVTLDPRVKKWTVVLCTTTRDPKPLKVCESQAAAAEWALAERDRIRAATGKEPTIHLPDDCPCYCNFPPPL